MINKKQPKLNTKVLLAFQEDKPITFWAENCSFKSTKKLNRWYRLFELLKKLLLL